MHNADANIENRRGWDGFLIFAIKILPESRTDLEKQFDPTVQLLLEGGPYHYFKVTYSNL